MELVIVETVVEGWNFGGDYVIILAFADSFS